MKKLPLSIVASSLAFSFCALAQENQLPTEAFLGAPSNGRVVMDTYGNCVRTTQWNIDKDIVGCGKQKPAPVQAAAPTPTAAAAPAAAPAAAAAPGAAAAGPGGACAPGGRGCRAGRKHGRGRCRRRTGRGDRGCSAPDQADAHGDDR